VGAALGTTRQAAQQRFDKPVAVEVVASNQSVNNAKAKEMSNPP
jgi:hypothetical protein